MLGVLSNSDTNIFVISMANRYKNVLAVLFINININISLVSGNNRLLLTKLKSLLFNITVYIYLRFNKIHNRHSKNSAVVEKGNYY